MSIRASFCILLLIPFASMAEESQRLSAEVLWQLDRLSAPVVSPDGRVAVVPVTSYADDTGEAESRLWLLNVDGEPGQRPLTAEGSKASGPVFSPDGSRLAFVGKRDDEEPAQIYVMPMRGPGEAVPLTDVPTGVSALRWVGQHIYFVSNVWPDKSFDEMGKQIETDNESKLSAKVWNEMPYSHWDSWLKEERRNHLYRIPAEGGDVESLTLPAGIELSRAAVDASDYDVAPDETTIALVADGRTEGIYADEDIFLLDVESGSVTNITDDNPASDDNPQFSPDGRRLAFARQHIVGFYGDQRKLMVHDVRAERTELLHEDWDRDADGLAWAANSKGLYASTSDNGTQRVFYLPLNGNAPKAVTDGTDFDGLSIAGDGTIVARNQSALYPPRVVELDGNKVRRLDAFNDSVLAGIDVGTYESVTYTGADGAEIQMWVHYPPGFDPDKEYPLFLLIHGGPHGAITESFHFRWNAQTFSSWGYVTAWPNFHGSSSFGQDFTDSINPDWATKPYADVIAAADWFLDKSWIDSERLVAGGGSYGGYLSSILLGREHPFNALVIHAAVYDMYAQTSADFAVHSERFGPYWENPEIYKSISPHYFAAEFATPSLVIHGQNDLRVPVGQAFELFRTLQTLGIESRLVYYPDENHWILTRDNSLHWYGEVQQWIERFAEPGPK